MNFDSVFQSMLNAAKGQIAAAGPQAQSYLEQVIQQQKDILREIAEKRVQGRLTDADVEAELADLTGDVKVSLEGVEVIAAEAAQRAWNSAIDVFMTALQKAL